ncbi:MAG: hypothetical protein EBQ94_13185 [Flavobacteriales bacterium]|nr:hypothetical protein [Flavobacteriales bacterium]
MNEQLSFLPAAECCPLLPPSGSRTEQCLNYLLEHGDITQLDWLREGKGWRLASNIKELDYLGWEPKSDLVKCEGFPHPIARYSLPEKAKRAAQLLMAGGEHVDP